MLFAHVVVYPCCIYLHVAHSCGIHMFLIVYQCWPKSLGFSVLGHCPKRRVRLPKATALKDKEANNVGGKAKVCRGLVAACGCL